MSWGRLIAIGFFLVFWWGSVESILRDIARELKRMNDREEKK
jgi:hypothetical protein